TGAVMDLTLISNTGASSVSKFFLTCISGERDPELVELQIKRDNSIVQLTSLPTYKTERSRPQEIKVNEFHNLNKQGIFYCIAQKDQKWLTTVTLISNFEKGTILSVSLAVHVFWGPAGNFYYTTHWTEFTNNTATLLIEGLTKGHEGVYSANYMGDSPLYGTYMRLIVRGMATKWGRNCDQDCPNCLNGGVCHDIEGVCICPPGFMGTHCETACREGMFSQNCQESCQSEQNCKGLTFCLSDPFGCTCASGWHGAHCTRPCGKDTYGAGCKLHCRCKNNGVCDRFSGCQCPAGWRGRNCEKSDHAPQILDMESSLEWNRNSSPKILCSAKGTPLPSHTSIELRKMDGTILKVRGDLSTAQFEIPHLSLEHGGVWECRVATNGGQDSRKFNLTVKEPPCPLTPPKLLEKRSKQLIVNPVVTYKGDGPIVSTKLLYKPMEAEVSWSSIIVYGMEPITLMNLKPSTRYFVKLQLTRPGEGGEGPPGPEAVMETDCPGEYTECFTLFSCIHLLTSFPGQSRGGWNLIRDGRGMVCPSPGPSPPRNVQATPISSTTVLLKWQPPEDPNGGIIKYIIEYLPVGQESLIPWVDTDDGNKTIKHVMELNSSTLYQFRVRAVSKVLGEWSKFVLTSTYGDGSPSFPPTMQGVGGRPGKDDYQLLVAVVGSVTVTCVTILVALLGLFCIRKLVFSRRKTFTYQSGSGEETILQFNSGTLTLTRRPKPQPEPLTYPILEWEDIKFEDVIGEGNFGQVIKAMIKKDGSKMSAAIKMLKEFASENDHRDFAGELEVLCKLGQHPNIINLIGACENRGYLYIAIEYAPYGNLLDFLRKSRVLETDPAFAKEHCTASTLTSQQLLQFAVDVATGMHYLSDKQFIHRDLAARNVLVGENLMAKIADFGLSRGEEVYVKKTMGRLPVRWMAIESLNYSVYTTKSDVWSFGVLLWEIVSLGGTPYCGMTCAELYEKLPQGYRMEQPKNCDDEVYELMRQCWRDRPYERPPFTQISVQLNRMQEARKAYVNMALFENFTYAGIDATAEEA
uniref:Tyrosine-protein kinase receptor Tie-1 n=1 Tax=Paramormyrops kingsleyae TaxID=1676925 RepID=A0A3B3SL89_9TELE